MTARLPRETGTHGVAPHVLFFGFYNILYFLPLLLVFLWGYAGCGAAEAVSMDGPTMVRVTWIYLAGFLGFLAGALLFSLLRAAQRTPITSWNPVGPSLRLSDRLIVALVAAIFLLSKIAIIPLGVYQEYTLTGELAGSGAWNFSMFCSETLALMSILVLFSRSRHNVRVFLVLGALNGINLLHGTRFLFIITVLAGALYSYTRGYLTLRRALILGPIALASLLVLAYVVFLSRSGASVEGAFSAARLLSPIVFESLFSQLSLVNLLRAPDLWSATGHAFNFVIDVMLNTMPRLVLPEKNGLLFFNRLAGISPLGAMNGYAAGLFYFGLFFPVLYLLLGFLASWLHMKAKTGPWWLILYAYFTADFLFRIMRDGYLIPVKMLINAIQIIGIVLLARLLFQEIRNGLRRAPQQAARPTSIPRDSTA